MENSKVQIGDFISNEQLTNLYAKVRKYNDEDREELLKQGHVKVQERKLVRKAFYKIFGNHPSQGDYLTTPDIPQRGRILVDSMEDLR